MRKTDYYILAFAVMITASILFLSATTRICNAKSAGTFENALRLLEQENILAQIYWTVSNHTYLCVVTFHETESQGITVPHRRLSVFQKVGGNLEKIYDFEPGDIFLSMYPLAEDGNLMTVWVSGSAYRLYVFSAVEDTIRIVLEEGTKMMPEIVDIDNDGHNEILVSTGSHLLNKQVDSVLSYPSQTKIYKWRGDSYQLLRTTPWLIRLNKSLE